MWSAEAAAAKKGAAASTAAAAPNRDIVRELERRMCFITLILNP
jgi:hypothetical protein